MNEHAEREIAHIHEAAADLLRICTDPEEAARYFTVAETPEVEENEFNLNLPRYVDTFEPEEEIPLQDAAKVFADAKRDASNALSALEKSLASLLEAGNAKR